MGNKKSRGNRSTLSQSIASSQGKQTPMSLDTLSIVHKNMTRIKARRLRFRNVENFLVIWLDSTISELNGDIQYSITQLRNIVNSIKTFTDPKQCMDFMNEIKDEKIFLVVSGTLGQPLLPLIENMIQIDSIYVFCRHKSQHKLWADKYQKIKGVFTKIAHICDRLKQDVRQCECDLTQMSIMSNNSTADTNGLDQSFMYSQLLKEVLVELEYTDQAKEELIEFCRQQYADNDRELAIIDEFKERYEQSSSIWWYTRECFVYLMLNKALRALDIEVIMRMGYFIRDLHHQIKQLHSLSDNLQPFIVYRGQGVSNYEFEKLKKSKGCLLSFNNFLSTSMLEVVSLGYARRARKNPDLIALLFRMEIDPSISSTPFASLDNMSYYSTNEKEVLFSMHTVFRIGDMEQIEDRLWQMDLTLTSENDQHLEHLTEYIRKEIDGKTGIHRIGALMIEMGRFDKAEEIYSLLLEKTSDSDAEELAILHHQLGYINDEKGDLTTAQCHYDCSIRIGLTYLPSDHPQLSTTYSNIGMILKKQGNLEAALKRFELALHLDLHALEPDQLKIAVQYNNIGLVLKDQGKYTDALKNYKRALLIFLNRLPSYHPDVARIYDNIGLVYDSMNDKLTALSYFEKTLKIEQKSLPSNHATLAITHHHIATVLDDLHRHEEAIKHAREAVDIARHAFASNHIQMQKYENYLTQLLSEV